MERVDDEKAWRSKINISVQDINIWYDKINHQTLKKKVLLYSLVLQPSSNQKLLLMIIFHL